MSAQESSRGRQAARPLEIPRQGWKDVLLRTKRKLKRDNVSIVAAGVAFYILLSIFPALATAVFLYGLIADPGQIENQVAQLSGFLPQNVMEILRSQMHELAQKDSGAMTAGAVGGLLFSLWSATKGIKTLMTALDITYDEENRRGFLKQNGLALLLTFGAIVFFVVAIALIAALPAALGSLGLGQAASWIISIVRWPLLAAAAIVAVGVLYRYAPYRDQPRWRWVSWGSIVATVLWIGASLLFSLYVSEFGSYNETYGSLGAVVVLMLWLYLTAYLVLLGSELNAEMEHQTREDTTRGEERPLGERGAYVADTVAQSPSDSETDAPQKIKSPRADGADEARRSGRSPGRS